MWRSASLAAAAALALAASAAALEGGDWNGDINGDPRPGSGIYFNVDRTDSGRKVKNVVASGLDYTCEDSSSGQTSGVEVQGSFKIDDDGEFGGRKDAVILGFDPPAKVTGRIKPGGKASGTIRVHGVLDPEENPGLKCDTGTLDWRATRGPL